MASPSRFIAALPSITRVTPRERQIIRRRFLGDGRETLAEIGDSFGVTKDRIRQLEIKALAKLRSYLGENTDCAALIPN